MMMMDRAVPERFKKCGKKKCKKKCASDKRGGYSLHPYIARLSDSLASSDVEAEAEVPEAVDLWWKRKRLKICHFRFRSVSKLLFKFW
jgi:hypothetical protein